MAEEKETPQEQPTQPSFNFAKNVVTNKAKELGALVEQMKQTNNKVVPPVVVPEIKTPAAEKKEEPADPLAEPIQDKSEIETPPAEQPKVEKKGKGGKKGKEEKKELPEIVDTDGKKVEIATFSEEDNNSFLELIGEKPEEQPTAQAEKQPKTTKKGEKTPLPKEIEDRLLFLETENRQFKSDPAFAIAKELIGKGKEGVKELMSKFDLTDYKSLPNKDIYELDLKSQGLEGEELTEAMSEFEDLPSYKQKTLTNPIRSKLQEQADEKLKTISNAPTEKQIREIAKYQQEATDNALATLDERFEQIATKGYNGWKPKEEDLEIIREGVMNNTVLSMKDGKPYYDVDKSIEQSIWMTPQIRNKILKYANELGRFKGYDDFISERVRVNPKLLIPGSQGGKPTYSFNNTVKPAQNGSN